MTKPTRVLISVLAVLAVLVGLVSVVVGSRSRPGSEPAAEHEGEGGDNASHAMAEALERSPSLAAHRQSLAFVSEKLEQSGGEGSGEVVNGPSQESYDQRAFPRRYIAPAQQKAAGSAFARALTRAGTPAGRTTLARSAGAATVARWHPLGPDGGRVAPEATYTGSPEYVSGRTTALAISRRCTARSCTLWAGTAGGGLWRSTNPLGAHPRWTSIGKGIRSTAIGSVLLAPNGDLYVGTGEPNGSSDSEAGVGLYRSTDGGRTFRHLRRADRFTVDRAIGAIAVDPRNPRHLLVGTAVARHGSSSVNGGRFTPPNAPKVGVYESLDGGRSWRRSLSQASDVVDPTSPNGNDFFRGGISKIRFDPTHRHVVYASMFDYGLFRADTRTARKSWRSIYRIKTPGDPASGLDSRVEFALATPRHGASKGRTRIYLGDATYYGNADDGFSAGFLRADGGAHGRPAWRTLSNPQPGTVGYASYNFCESQCSYDMVVESPREQPGEVLLSGSMNYDELLSFGGPGSSNGRAVIRSTDRGRTFTDMTNDGRVHPHGLHPDHHALVFVPRTAGTRHEQFFTGSDGGVVRTSGPWRDRSTDCGQRGVFGPARDNCEQWLSAVPSANVTLNKDLQTLQFQSVSVARSGVVQGGTQDNGTWESDQGGFSETVGGDGGQSDFDATDTDVRYHAYYGSTVDVSFHGGTSRSWNYMSEPLDASGEAASFYVPLRADPQVSGTAFAGLQHVWRTTDGGGDRAFLEKYCNELTGDFGERTAPCGDWQPLGGTAGDLSGGDPGNYVVAVERATQAGSETLWAATRKGDLYVSRNADAADPAAVTFTKYDDALALPNRFVSGISVDPADPDHAYLSYSGYSAYSPGGHVYEVTVDPSTATGAASDLSGSGRAGIGDQPVTDLVYSPATRSLYAATDFGVLTRTLASARWVATPGLPRVAVYGLTLDQRGSRLYAATHGRSVWRLRLG